MTQITFVKLTEQYQDFVINSFLKSYRNTRTTLQNAEYYSTYSKIFIDYATRFDLTLAVNSEDTDQIFGWILTDRESNTLVYIYVKHAFRNMNIANELMINSDLNWDEQVFARFLTPVGQKIAQHLNIVHSEIEI